VKSSAQVREELRDYEQLLQQLAKEKVRRHIAVMD
jgi:hypothetical protein